MAPIVLKLGGDVIAGPYLGAIASDVAALARAGTPVVLVHGGGPQATALQKQLGQTPNIVGGRRITDEATLDVMKMTLAGKVNVDLCAALVAAGARPVGLHGASSCVIRAVKRPPRVVSGGGPDPIDFGFVGDVTGLRHELLSLLLDAGYVPVLACLGADEGGNVYNINADVVANQSAIALGARSLFLVTDVPAVLRDVADPTSRIPRLSLADGKKAIADGVVTKGMIPKLDESFAAIAAGVRAVHIVGRLQPGDLAREAADPGSVGTVLVP
ncbi:acetylglutamate kinase [Pendulispora brunnea]|uniref:Acetylglutamate kinase n=1 Tax=Pendulispora brunnea TaxID=2905690 RepID=A0ABZ2KQI8_9BACT